MTRSKNKSCRVCGAFLSYGTRGDRCLPCWRSSQRAGDEPNPTGLCQCGCGEPAPIAKQTVRATGALKGKPLRFVRGHFQLRTQEAYRVEDRGYSGGPCWIWQRHINDQGYGVMRPHGRAHRVMYETVKGEIPEGLQLDHLCRVRSCVNPDHLEPVTSEVNVARGNSPSVVTMRLGVCKRGHDLSLPDALYVQPKSGKRTCERCRQMRIRAAVERRSAMRKAKRVVMTIDVEVGR